MNALPTSTRLVQCRKGLIFGCFVKIHHHTQDNQQHAEAKANQRQDYHGGLQLSANKAFDNGCGQRYFYNNFTEDIKILLFEETNSP